MSIVKSLIFNGKSAFGIAVKVSDAEHVVVYLINACYDFTIALLLNPNLRHSNLISKE